VSVNLYRPHLAVIPEDDANRQMAIGFITSDSIPPMGAARIGIERSAGGWQKATEHFHNVQVDLLRKYKDRRVLILIDFDNEPDRLARILEAVPDDIADRVFVLGAASEPERLKAALQLKRLEQIGEAVARDCSQPGDFWDHDLLRVNLPQVERLRTFVQQELFI